MVLESGSSRWYGEEDHVSRGCGLRRREKERANKITTQRRNSSCLLVPSGTNFGQTQPQSRGHRSPPGLSTGAASRATSRAGKGDSGRARTFHYCKANNNPGAMVEVDGHLLLVSGGQEG